MALDILQTPVFIDWLTSLRDRRAAAKIAQRIDRMREGNFGDHKSVGDGVCELRIGGAGPGYRVYYMWRGDTLIVLLCGGDKDDQDRDIARAHAMTREISR